MVDQEWSGDGDGDGGYGRRCVVCVVVLNFLQRGTYLGVCRHFCGQILSSDFVHIRVGNFFIEPSAKPTRARALGTN